MKGIVLDIGGTNSRIAVVSKKKGKIDILDIKKVRTNSYKTVSKFIKSFTHLKIPACIAFAGVIKNDKVNLTNGSLVADKKTIMKECYLPSLFLINDFLANSYAVHHLETVVLQKGEKQNNFSVVVGPGTGLGQAYVLDGNHVPSEGGHVCAGYQNPTEKKIIEYFKESGTEVHYEDIISGSGILKLQSFFSAGTSSASHCKVNGSLLSYLLENKSKPAMKKTFEYFTRFYARFCRDSVLNLLASNLYLVGGITETLSEQITNNFCLFFNDHKTHSNFLKNTSIYLIEDENIGIIGAAYYLFSKI